MRKKLLRNKTKRKSAYEDDLILNIFGNNVAQKEEEKEKEKDTPLFDKDAHLKNMIEEYKHMERDVDVLRGRIDRRIGGFMPKGESVYIKAKVCYYNYHDKLHPIVVELESGDELEIQASDIINKEIFESPMGELLYGEVSTRQNTNNDNGKSVEE